VSLANQGGKAMTRNIVQDVAAVGSWIFLMWLGMEAIAGSETGLLFLYVFVTSTVVVAMWIPKLVAVGARA
jgi:hypothetical protein